MYYLLSVIGILLLGAASVLGAPGPYDISMLSKSHAARISTPDILTKRANSAGCGKTSTTTSGAKSITVNGRNRQYIIRVPSGYNMNRPYKLIFAFHWVGGTMNDVAGGGTDGALWAYYGMQRKSAETAILVAPQGLNNGWANSGGEDIAFVDAMRQTIENDLCVDTTQRFATGFSYGGSMSFSIACSRARDFRAVAVISGGQLSGCDGGSDPIAYLGIHGISDGTLPISGGRALRDRFVRNNGCANMNPQEPAAGSGTHTKTTYSGCRAGYPVTWIAFDGGHGPAPVDGGGDSGARSYTPDEIWSFFTGLPGSNSTATMTPPVTSATSTPATTTTQSGGNCAARWGQCGGQGWTGSTCCQAGSTCQVGNPWYSQCL